MMSHSEARLSFQKAAQSIQDHLSEYTRALKLPSTDYIVIYFKSSILQKPIKIGAIWHINEYRPILPQMAWPVNYAVMRNSHISMSILPRGSLAVNRKIILKYY